MNREILEEPLSRCALVSGFSVHAGVSVRAEDRKGLERLCSYIARPSLAVERLAQLPDGRLSYRLKTPWKSGTTHVIFDPLEFIARLAALVPAPRSNLVRCFGMFGPAAKWRSSILPASAEIDFTPEVCGCGNDDGVAKKHPRNYAWAAPMSRVVVYSSNAQLFIRSVSGAIHVVFRLRHGA